MFEHVESAYGFLFPWQQKGASVVDMFIPWHMLDRLQLRPGSKALVQGLLNKPPTEVHVRPSKGTETLNDPIKPFIATVRLPNRPGALFNFLSQAYTNGIDFTSIRTSGVRAEAFSDIQLEGGMVPRSSDEFDPAEAITNSLAISATEASGSVIHSSAIQYQKPRTGRVLTALYLVDLPVLRGRYGIIRVNLSGAGRPLKSKEDAVHAIRVQLDPLRMSLTLDFTFSELSTYILQFEAVDLKPKAAVTLTLLETIKKHAAQQPINVDALDAFEYLAWHPGTDDGEEEAKIRRVGVIESLLARENSVDHNLLQTELLAAVVAKDWTPIRPSVIVRDLVAELGKDSRLEMPDDSGCKAFLKVLSHGRYFYLEHVGRGSFGDVGKYLDLHTGQVVAGKHLNEETFDDFEARNLQVLTRESKSSKHVIDLRDYFLDGELPVLIMGFVEHTLDGHRFNPSPSSSKRIRHNNPSSTLQYIDMAVQLLEGLAWLHSAHRRETERFIHSDIKPDNIGFFLIGDETVWKLLDLGLSKRLPVGLNTEMTLVPGGSPFWMSPQALLRMKDTSNDIYSLGVVLFQVWNAWQHPTRTPPAVLRKQLPDEIIAYKDYLGGLSTQEPADFDPDRWSAASPFSGETVTVQASVALRDIVFRMIALSTERRYPDAESARDAFVQWKKTWGHGLDRAGD